MVGNSFLIKLLELQQDGKQAISSPGNWFKERPLLEVQTQNKEEENSLIRDILIKDSPEKGRWHFIIGSPGNGKSVLMGNLCQRLIKEEGCRIFAQNDIPLEELEEDEVPYSLRIFEKENPFSSAMVVQDASVVPNPFEKEIDPSKELVEVLKVAWDKGQSLIICTNRGVIEKAFWERHLDSEIKNKGWFKALRSLMEENNASDEEFCLKFDSKGALFQRLTITQKNLENESLLLEEEPIFGKLVEEAVKAENWETCYSCENAKMCPFKSNRDWLKSKDGMRNFLNILRRAEVFSGQIIVFREAVALISFLLAGCPDDYEDGNPCKWVGEKISNDDIFSLATRRIYMSVFASFSGFGLESDPVLNQKQLKAIKNLLKHGDEWEEKKTNAIKHLIKSEKPKTDVGVKRLTGENGIFSEIDPIKDCLSTFFQKRGSNLPVNMDSFKSPFFTDIEKSCLEIWKFIEEFIENSVSVEAQECYWTIQRWKSNFELHFGALVDGFSAWEKELEQYINVFQIINNRDGEFTEEELLEIRDLNKKLENLIAIGSKGENSRENSLNLNENVELQGEWVKENLKPQVETNLFSNRLSLTVNFRGGETSELIARAFVWLNRHLNENLDIDCFPFELFLGTKDARVRAASKGGGAYAFADDDVKLLVDSQQEGKFIIERVQGRCLIDASK